MRRTLSIAIGWLALTGPVLAQQSTLTTAQATQAVVAAVRDAVDGPQAASLEAVAERHLERAIKRTLIEAAVADPMATSGTAAAQHQLTVLADKGDVVGRARFFLPLGPQADAQLTFSAPLSAGKATFASLDGLAPKGSFAGALKYTIWTKVRPLTTTQASAVGAAFSETPAAALAAVESLRQRAAAGPQATSALAASLSLVSPDQLTPGLRRLLLSPTLVQSPERFYAALAQAVPAFYSATWAAYVTPGFEANHHSIDYLESGTFALHTYDETDNLFTLAGGVSLFRSWRESADGADQRAPVFFAGASFRGGHSSQAGDPRNICRPEGTAGVTECFEQPVGIPARSNLASWTVELRQWNPTQTLGINPRFTRSATTPDGQASATVVKTIDVPIYFMRKVKDISVPDVDFGADLIGGVNVGWRETIKGDGSRTSGGFVTFFLSKAFGLP